jgi:ABC-type uncharacterized transport system permease subunit
MRGGVMSLSTKVPTTLEASALEGWILLEGAVFGIWRWQNLGCIVRCLIFTVSSSFTVHSIGGEFRSYAG